MKSSKNEAEIQFIGKTDLIAKEIGIPKEKVEYFISCMYNREHLDNLELRVLFYIFGVWCPKLGICLENPLSEKATAIAIHEEMEACDILKIKNHAIKKIKTYIRITRKAINENKYDQSFNDTSLKKELESIPPTEKRKFLEFIEQFT